MKTALTLVLVLTATTALANDVVSLAPGRPAGLHQAQRKADNRIWIVTGAAAIGIGVALAISSNGSGPTAIAPITTATTTTTS